MPTTTSYCVPKLLILFILLIKSVGSLEQHIEFMKKIKDKRG